MGTAKGIQYIILSGLCFFVVNFMVKILTGNAPNQDSFQFQEYGAHELVFFRSVISFSISAYYVKKCGLPFFGNNKKWLLVRGFAGVTALTIFFFTLQHLPLAIAAVVQYLSPIFTVILAVLVLNEKVLKAQWIFIISAFSGVLLIGINNILDDANMTLDTTWLILGVLSSFFAGIAYLAIIKLKHTDSPINIVMYFPMLAIPITGIWCMYDFVMPLGWEWLVLLFIGVFTQFAQILMTKALHATDTARVVPFKYLGAIYALFVGWYYFDERLNLILIIGIGLIVLSVVANALYQKRTKA